MNVAKGAKRMRRAGRWLGFASLAALAPCLCVGQILGSPGTDIYFRDPSMTRLTEMNLLNIGLIAIPLFAGWILKGLAKDAHS